MYFGIRIKHAVGIFQGLFVVVTGIFAFLAIFTRMGRRILKAVFA